MPERLQKVGKFLCRVLPAPTYLTESAKKGTPRVELPLEVMEGLEQGQQISGLLYLTPEAFDRTLETLHECFEFDGDLGALFDGSAPLGEKLCQIETERRSFEGKDYLEVKWINPVGGGGGSKPLSPEKFRALLESFGRRARASRGALAPLTTPQRGGGHQQNLPF
jgi:hypothetical protein